MRRGKGTAVDFYAMGVHQDYGVNEKEFVAGNKAYGGEWLENYYNSKFDRAECTGHTNLVFWRVTNMEGPCQYKPLAVCDPNTVDRKDHIPTAIVGFPSTLNGADTNNGAIRYNPG